MHQNTLEVCGLQNNGSVSCWGIVPGEVPETDFLALSVGLEHSCGITTDNEVVCWGENMYGQASAREGIFTHVSVHGWHSCGINQDSLIQCWGNDSLGQSTPPTEVLYQ